MQEKGTENRIITVQGYYKSLAKKEKSKMLLYICNNYGYMQNTIRSKLAGQNNMRDYELQDCEETINNEQAWRI